MTVDIQALSSSPVGIMEIRAFAISHGCTPDGRVFLTPDCVTYKEFCREIDLLIERLNELKPRAQIKFDEVKRTSP